MLNCGSSPALDSITGKVDEIKGKLAEGMAALGDLESKANEALAELQAALPECLLLVLHYKEMSVH